MNIDILHNSKIDCERWDKVLGAASNSRIYAMSWYLDILNPDWYGIVFDNYSYVMPVIFARKMGVRYAYQPMYAQQHGIFPTAPPDVAQKMIQKLKSKIKYFEININSDNSYLLNDVESVERLNYLLPLNASYDDLYSHFSDDCKRNLKRAYRDNLLQAEISSEDFFNFKSEHGKVKLNSSSFSLFKLLVHQVRSRNVGFVRGAYSKNNELTGAALFMKHNNRLLYVNAVSSNQGKKNRSMYAILNSVIEQYEQQPLILDFEGSNIEGIAKFFASFGASPEIYRQIKYNNLPFLLKRIKK